MHQFEQLPKHFSYKALLCALRRENINLIIYFLLSMCVNKGFVYHNFIVIIFLSDFFWCLN